MIGLFVLGAIALVVVAIVTLGSGKLFKRTTTAVCYFEGSVGGLNEGAPVVFRGVKIGTVKEIAFRFDPQKVSVTIPVFIELGQRRERCHEGGDSRNLQTTHRPWFKSPA